MNDSYISIKKIADTILALEKEHNLLGWKIDDVFVWQSARVLIYCSILDLILPKNAYQIRKSFLEKLKIYYNRFIINSIFYNPFLDFNKVDALVFESGRKYLVDDNYIDIYTKYFCEDLEQEQISYTKYNISYLVDDFARFDTSNKHLDFIFIASKALSHLIKVVIKSDDYEKLKTIEKEISEKLKIRISLKNIFVNEIKCFKSRYPFYKLLFQIKKNNRIYLINSFDKAPLIKAAKDKHIIVNELQHGLIVKDDLMDHFPDTVEDSLAYFPDKFYIWKDLNMCTCKLPLSNENIIPFTNKHLQYMLEKNTIYTRLKDQILVVSQPYCSNEILKFIMDNIEAMKNWRFVYKVHPTEDINSFSDNSVYQFSQYSNLTFVANDISIYRLFSESEYIIGVFSTALFEATYFGCKIILLNLPGAEIAYPLMENNNAVLVDTKDRLKDSIRT